jgi:hypothetical protein
VEFHTFERDGDHVWELDAEAIDYLIDGLERLRECEPGTELSSPSAVYDADGGLEAMASHVLLRADDEG